MKKEMFNVWYKEYGRGLAKEALPIDDVNEKELRMKAKEIFSHSYDIFFDYMNERLLPISTDIVEHVSELDELYERFIEKKYCAENIRDEIIPRLTTLYDLFYKNKSIDKEQFDSLKSYFGEIYSNAKATINRCDEMISVLKREKRCVESLLVTK